MKVATVGSRVRVITEFLHVSDNSVMLTAPGGAATKVSVQGNEEAIGNQLVFYHWERHSPKTKYEI